MMEKGESSFVCEKFDSLKTITKKEHLLLVS